MNYVLYLIFFVTLNIVFLHIKKVLSDNRKPLKGLRGSVSEVRNVLYPPMDKNRRFANNDNAIDVGQNKIPALGPEYMPSVGFDLYWYLGDWVMSTPKTITSKPAENLTNFDCGFECGSISKLYGKVCARNTRFHYKTFANSCGVRSIDCSGYDGWRVIYRGDCRNSSVHYRNDIVSKVNPIINEFMSNYKYTDRYVGHWSRTMSTKTNRLG